MEDLGVFFVTRVTRGVGVRVFLVTSFLVDVVTFGLGAATDFLFLGGGVVGAGCSEAGSSTSAGF